MLRSGGRAVDQGSRIRLKIKVGYLWGGELHGDGSKFGYNPAPRGHDGVNLILGHRVARGCGKAWDGQASFVVYSGFGHRP